MHDVSSAKFFAFIGPRDVNPRVRINSLKNRHHISDWETPNRQKLGETISDSWGIEPTKFYLAREQDR